MYGIKIDGKEKVAPIKMGNPKSYENAKVYLADDNYPAAKAKVRNLIIGDCDYGL